MGGTCFFAPHPLATGLSEITTGRKLYQTQSCNRKMFKLIHICSLPITNYIFNSQINKNKDRTQDVAFSRFRVFSFTITLRQKPKGVTHMLSLCLLIQRSITVTPFGFYLRVIVNEKPLNLKKTTSSVLSLLLLIYVKLHNRFAVQFQDKVLDY